MWQSFSCSLQPHAEALNQRLRNFYSSPTKPHTDPGNVCSWGCVHARLDALWAQLDSTVHEREHVVVCVLGTAHLCVHPARWCSLLLKPSGAVTPLPPHQPVSSLPSLGLPLPRCLLLSLIQSLTVSWWMVPSWWGDNGCNCSVSLFLSLGSWKVLYFRDEIPLARLRWPFSSSCTPDTSVLNSNHISIDVLQSLLV